MEITLWVELVLFVILMGFSGFFSSAETSLFSLSKIQLEQLRRDGHASLNRIERLLSQPRRLIVTILIGNEFVNVAASVISAAIVIQLLGAENKYVNLFIMVPILLLVGEITPKTLAIRNNVAFATFQSHYIALFANLISPLRWLVRQVADWVTTLIVGKERSRANIVTEDMVRTLAREAVGEGVLNPVEARYIDHIFEFGDKTVEDVMTPRSNVFFLPADMALEQMLQELRRTRRTKVPVFHENRNNILGVLYARDLLGMEPASPVFRA
jgi:putative hemolysin